ncbi:2-oxo acid dehydrogenase subunit E2 [Rhodoblastus sp.]|uniref:2-oxo acid dehydrogenase subunit E2 n=1 Tax=Rhodoblastus sp. TaxID=1962975 RepID=UPI0026128CDE|nr:2-oxo acid dehydrogenase subunit E2 [Rhodoblastus sp.]
MAIAILMPSIEPSMRTGRLTRWLRRPGDFVEAGEVVAEISGAHGTTDVEAPQAGILTHIFVAAGGEAIAVNAEIGRIEPGPPPPARSPASPRARRLAREADVDLSPLAGRGPHGRIVEADVRAALDRRAAQEAGRMAAGGARSLGQAAEGAPVVHLEVECRLDALEVFRARLNARGLAPRISLLDCAVKALALALARVPEANVARAGARHEPARRADVAIALGHEGEIVAPTFVSANEMALDEIAAARADFLAGRFSSDSFEECACLIVNLGGLGVRRVLPAVMAPWTSVLGLGAAEQRIIVEQGRPAVATMISVTLAIDRRAIAEPAAGALLAAFKALIEKPEGLVEE